MELAATLMWRTHYINLTPMYFNKAEGCYKYRASVLLCGHFFCKKNPNTSLSALFIKTLLQNLTNEPTKVQFLHPMHKCCR